MTAGISARIKARVTSTRPGLGWQLARLALGCFIWLVASIASLASVAMAAGAENSANRRAFAFAQPKLDSVGDAESVPDNLVTALAQDARGFIWIGSQQGLLRYDGYRFRNFVHNDNNPASLSGNYVTALFANQDGRIWIGTESAGLSLFDPGSERFEHFKHEPKQANSVSAGRIWALAGDKQGGLWIATDNGLDFLPSGSGNGNSNGNGNKSVVHYRHEAGNPNSLTSNKIRSLLLDRQGRLWVGTTTGLQRLSEDHKRFEMVAGGGKAGPHQSNMPQPNMPQPNIPQPIGAPAASAEFNVQTLLQAQDGKLWLGTNKHGAAWLEPESDVLHWLPRILDQSSQAGQAGQASPVNALSNAWVIRMVQVHDQIWMATFGGGIQIVDANNGKVLQHLQHDPGLAGSLAANEVKPMLLDRSGLLWIGTWSGGLQRYNTKNWMVRLLQRGQFLPGGLSNANAHSVLELANGQILVGTDGNGIDIIDRERGLVGGYRSANGAGSLPDGSIHALAQTRDGAIWAGTKQAGVLRLQAGSQTWQTVLGLPQSVINRFLLDRNGDLWVATDRGVGRWKAGQTGLAQFDMMPGENANTMQVNITTLAEDQDGRIWAGSTQGLWVSSADKSVLHKIAAEPERPNGLVSDAITSMLTTRDGKLWLATAKGLERLIRLDGTTATFEQVSKNWKQIGGGQIGGQQPPPLMFGNLLEAQNGTIWSETSVIDPQKMQIRRLSKTDGIDVGVAWQGAHGKTQDGLLLFGGTQGLAVVNPALFQPWDEQAPLVVTELKINGNPAPLFELAFAPTKQPKKLPSLILEPGQQNFVFEFAALDYSASKQNRYQYRLQGYDNTWINTDSDHRHAAYGNLRPGNYTLQVRGSNRLGQWSEHELTVPIRVIPAIWQTWWFMALLMLLLASATWGIFRWRTERLKKLVAARTADILQLGKIGQELTATLDTEQAFERVYKQVSSRLDAHVFRIGIYDEEQAHIRFVYGREAAQHLPQSHLPMSEHDRPAVWCVRERRELIVANSKQLTNYVSTILPPSFGQPMETVVYLPLMLESRMIGCLSVQSPHQNAYDQNKIEFLRVLASYAAIAIANSAAHGELESSHGELALAHHALDNAHTELANSHRYLQETQSQLIQSEKMASLGQLVANIAHEINTPIGAVKASGSNIADALRRTLVGLPKMIKVFSESDEQLFHAIIRRAANVTETYSSREARAARLVLTEQLNQESIPNASSKADILVQLHAQNHLSEALPLLRHPQADFILATTNDVASILNNTRNINLALARVSKIVFALNSFTLNSSGGHLIETDLAESLETVLTLYQSQIKKDTQLICEFAKIAPVLCRPDELNQVWTNLIYNALQAMTFQGTLTLGIRREGNYAIVSVKDTGCGIPESIREKIFDPFFTTRPAGEGSGLGLDIVKKIITKHHGKIQVESEIGIGTTFLVYLPYEVIPT